MLLPVMARISPEQVRSEVHRFWQVLTCKSKDPFEEFYSPDATVITGKAKRAERAQLAVARRKREIAQTSDASVELGAIDVEIVGDQVAIASYTYNFRRIRKRGDGDVRRDTPHGRATHVFQRDAAGSLRIAHEHLSSAAPTGVQPVPRE